REQGVKLSTVRTQIASVREKTGTPSIGALVRLAAGLPPMVSALRT
ncbi:MAG: helix-turn-helix transcriptional regulator, partial [Rubrivivax sp.]|nr:helix-turn-helix transcriptional regulator [Rubrivivax sp.]